MTTDIVLASTSTSRREMLDACEGDVHRRRAGCGPKTKLRHTLTAQNLGIPDIAAGLAQAKALAVSGHHPHALVLGADQILECDGEIFTKAKDET